MERADVDDGQQSCLSDSGRLLHLVGCAGIGIFVSDMRGRLVAVNGSWLSMHGYAQEGQVLGQAVADFLDEPGVVSSWLDLGESADCASPLVGEVRFLRRDGTKGHARYTVCRSACGDGIDRIEGLLVDISLTVQATEALQRELASREGELESASRALVRFEGNLRSLLKNTREAVFVHDHKGRIVDVNDEMLRMYGVSRERVPQHAIAEFMGRDCSKEQLSGYWKRVLQGEVVTFPWIGRRLDDAAEFPVEVVLRRISLEDGEFILANVRDVSEAHKASERLELFGKVFENALEGISITDESGIILSVNQAFTTITGYSAEEVVGQNPRILRSDRHDTNFYREMWRILIERGRWEGEIWNRRKSGEVYPEWLSISRIPGGGQARYIAVFHDISEMKNKEYQIIYQAHHDALTGLPNRLALRDRLSVATARARRRGLRVAVIFVDLDDFKNVNDALGHAVGDEILVNMAERLKKLITNGDTLARLGSDEFVLLLTSVRDENVAAQVAERVSKRMNRPFKVRGHEVFLTASIGIAFFPDDGEEADELLKNADLAMSQSKTVGKNTYSMYAPQMNERVNRRIRLAGDLRKAMMRREFEPFYQAKVDARRGRVVGMEALVRWRRPDGSLVAPGEFIPLAEETGIIVPLGEQFNLVVAGHMRELEGDGLGGPGLVVSINVSPRQFQQDNFVALLRNMLQTSTLPPERFDIEITESAIMTDIGRTAETLVELRDMGMSVSIDDFGTGYSSLAYLKRFPIDTLKIDQSFVRDLSASKADASIVATIIDMARNMGMRTVAEGVETEEQAALLSRMGCDVFQGYLFSRPLAYSDFRRWLADRQAGGVPLPGLPRRRD